MQFEIPMTSGETLQLELGHGETLYIVGKNGSGKSALLSELLGQSVGSPSRWLSARRQVHLSEVSGSTGFMAYDETNYRQDIAESRRTIFENQLQKGFMTDVRWQELEPVDRLTKPLFDFLTKETRRAYTIADRFDRGTCAEEEGEESNLQSPTSLINRTLRRAGLNISIRVEPDWKIVATNHEGEPYDLSHASDGERNAVVMAATVLTAPEGSLILIDEPDRHLHSSVIVPFMAALADLRDDSLFVIATYDSSLPDSNRNAGSLVVRSCQWASGKPTSWDLDQIEPGQLLPEEVRSALLGARTKTILVEGTETSLDSRLYAILFPGAEIKPSGGNGDVENAVAALRENSKYTRIEAYGIVDGDGRPEQPGGSTEGSGIYVMEAFCVECLYYCEDAVRAVAMHLAPTAGVGAQEIVEEIKQSVLARLDDDDIATQMAARRSWRRISVDIVRQAPSVRDIMVNDDPHFEIRLDSPKKSEIQHYRELLQVSDFDALAARYPIYKSNVLEAVPRLLGLRDREAYQNTLLHLVTTDSDLANKLRGRMGAWANQLATDLGT